MDPDVVKGVLVLIACLIVFVLGMAEEGGKKEVEDEAQSCRVDKWPRRPQA